MKFIREHIFFVFVLTVCAILRLLPLFNYQFTYDEISGLERTQFNSFGELIQKGIQVDAHPALIQIFLFYMVKLFGFKAWLIKLPFLVCSLGSVVFAYLIGLKNFSKIVGQIFASFLAFSLIFVFYAPVARMYGCGVLFSLGLLYYFFEIVLQQKNTFKNYLYLGLFVLLSALNHHMNALFAAIVLIGGLFLLQKNQFKNYLLTCVLIVVGYSPHLSITLHQLGLAGIGTEQQGWLNKPYWDAFYTFSKVMFGTGYLFFMVLLFILITVASNKNFSFSKIQYFLLFVFVINYLIIYLYSVLRAPIFQNSVMLYSGTALLLLACSLLDAKEVYVSQFALGLLTCLLIYQTYFTKDYFHEGVQNNYEVEFERANFYKNKFGENNVAAVFLDADPIMKTIYFSKFNTFDCFVSTDSMARSIKKFAEYLAQSKSTYLVLGAGLPAFHALAKQYFPFIVEGIQKQNVYCYVYSKIKQKNNSTHSDSVLFHSNRSQRTPFNYAIEKSTIKTNDSTKIQIDSLIEFPFAAKGFYHEVFSEEGQMLLVKTKFKLKNLNADIQTCISIRNPETNKIEGYNAGSTKDFLIQTDSTVTVYTQYYAGTNHRQMNGTSQIACYVWNTNHSAAELLDFEICCIDFWPRRWNYWE